MPFPAPAHDPDAAFDLLHLRVVRRSGSAALARRVDALLEHFGARRTGWAGVPDLELAFHEGPPGEPPAGDPLHLDVRVARGPEGLVLWSVGGVCRVTADGRASDTRVPPGAEVPLHLLTYLLVHQLRSVGLHTLHAAGVTRGDGSAWVIVGDSGRGKSTLALSLVGQGFGLLSDDSLLLRRSAAGLEVLPLRRGVFLDPRSADELFPSLRGRWRTCPLMEATKLQLTVDEVFPGRQALAARPARLLVPEVGRSAETTFEELAPNEVLFDLVRHSNLAELDAAGAQAHFELLAELAGAAPALRLALGRDVVDHPDRFARRLLEAST